MREPPLTWEVLLSAYAQGYFPMAESRDAKELHWFYPEKRGIIPLDSFHVPRSLAKFARTQPFALTTDRAFVQVIRACAEREETWINDTIIKLYCELWEQGHAHSVECWQEIRSEDRAAMSHASCENQEIRSGGNYELVGGLYGVALGGAFFGESMFSRQPNASKIALVHLVQLLRGAGYRLLDAQYINPHLKQFGIIEIPRAEYLVSLKEAMPIKPKLCFGN
jgi:leucyl/phenylalanyl-tRNA--protein transferase